MELATIAFKQFGYLQKSNINQEAMELYHGAGVIATPGVRCKRSKVAGSIETADGEVVEGTVPGKVTEVVGKQGRTDRSLVVELGSLLC